MLGHVYNARYTDFGLASYLAAFTPHNITLSLVHIARQ